MLAIRSIEAVVGAIERGKSIEVGAYVLRTGRVLRALEAAADRGATVHVRLEGAPYGSGGAGSAVNEAAVRDLQAHGAAASLTAQGAAPLHLKAAIIDGTAYLDDRNWADHDSQTIVVTTAAEDVAAVRSALAGKPSTGGGLTTVKGDALALEAATILGAAGDRIDCQSEAFGFSPISAALRSRAEAGAHVRLLVAAQDERAAVNLREAQALRSLQRSGVEIRITGSDEKLCVAGDAGWVGSANATFGWPETIDWGLQTRAPGIVETLRGRFASNWAAGSPYIPPAKAPGPRNAARERSRAPQPAVQIAASAAPLQATLAPTPESDRATYRPPC